MDRRNGFPETWQEARRKPAFELKQHGWKQCVIAEAFGVSPAAVSQWLANMREHGVEACGGPSRDPQGQSNSQTTNGV
jgi:predicted transcriptional regulator